MGPHPSLNSALVFWGKSCSSAEFCFTDILESCALISCGNCEFIARFNNSLVKMVANY